MENNNENQVSTEQYYANVEEEKVETPVPETQPVVEEEQSYSLEDLHPEEEVVETPVAPVAAPSEEVQPDPTVIDGIKAPVMNPSPVMEQPVQSSSFSQNALEPDRSAAPAPVGPHPVTNVKNTAAEAQNTAPNAKVFYAVIAVIILLLAVGIPLYTSINNSLNNSSGKSEPVEKNDKDENKEKPSTETPTTPTPQTPTTPINFDMSLTFDKGLVENQKEVNQKTGFLPTKVTGIVRCDLEKPVVMEGIRTYGSTYLYYENYRLKSAITVTKQQYPNQELYQNTKDATMLYKTAGDKYDAFDADIIQDDQNYIVTNIMKYNLVYGHSIYIEDINSYIIFSSSYDTNINNAINNVLTTGINSGNSMCSSIITE